MFFRHGAESTRHAVGRPRGSDEAQLKELRARARRRLVGALALVLAAVIVVPWLFEEPVTDDTHAPVVVPAVPRGLPTTPPPSVDSTGGAATTSSAAGTTPEQPGSPAAAQGPADTPEAGASTASGVASAGTVEAPQTSEQPATAAAPRPPSRPAPAPETKPAETVKPATRPVERTDDGSVALALLAGKTPAASESSTRNTAARGHYVLQVAAYVTEQDALARRDSLRQAGVTDAYVERGQSSGRTVYRLRVGPFGSHEAAQAAQARLRALGYQNGLISGN